MVAGLPTEVDIWMDRERDGGSIEDNVMVVGRCFMIEAPL